MTTLLHRVLRARAPAFAPAADAATGPGSRVFAAGILLCLLFWAAGCSKPAGWRILDPQQAEIDYDIALGRIPFGEVREHVVRLRNEEGRAVAVEQITSGCSCTMARAAAVNGAGVRREGPSLWGEAPFVVEAGEVLEIRLRVDSASSPNPNAAKRVLVRIHSDSTVDPAKTLEVHFVVDMPFYVVPKRIDLGQVPVGGIAQGKTEITGATGGGELILGVLQKPDAMDVVLETPEQTGTSLWRLHVRWFPPLEPGPQEREVVLETSGPGGQGLGRPLTVRVQAIGVENVIAEPLLFSVPGRLEKGTGSGAVSLRSLVGGNRLRVLAVRPEGPAAECFSATASPLDPDDQGRSEQWTVQLTCVEPPRLPGAFSGHVVVTLDDPATPQVRIPYVRKAAP